MVAKVVLSNRHVTAFLLISEDHPILDHCGARIPVIIIILAHETASTELLPENRTVTEATI
ncbi:hypothetical protein SY26_19140 [Paracoccus sp. 228]|nr:hypothetical protein SY26_19140 [Paracoccus sp. 228]